MIFPSLQGNWVDFIIIILLVFYVIEGIDRGFWFVLIELVTFIGSFAAAFRLYPFAARFLIANFSFPNSFANAVGFLLVAFGTEIILGFLAARLLALLPDRIRSASWIKYFSFIPSLLDGVVLIAFFATVLIALPIDPRIKASVNKSKIGGYLVSQTAVLEKTFSGIFGPAIKDTLTYLTVEPESKERIDLTYKPSELSIDRQSEQEMFDLVNKERRKGGLREFVWDERIAEVARAHSRDMWERQYFSHVSPEGKDVGDRLEEAGIRYTMAGENLALAPTVTLAHQGLMNSAGHRANILEPRFRKVGIGVVDGGIYGKMFTQNFTD